MMNSRMKRWTAAVLALVIALSCAPFASAQQVETVIPASRQETLTAEEEAQGVVYFGAVSARAEERGDWVLTVFRDGNTDQAAEVTLQAIDFSALLGEDYDLPGLEIDRQGDGRTILEKNAGVDADRLIRDFAAGMEQTLAQEAPDSQDPVAPQERIELAQAVNDYQAGHLGDNTDWSGQARLVFAPGETEKTLRIRVLEDRQAEDDETFLLLLTDPDGARVGESKTLTFTIADDEPREEAYVSFAQDSFDLDETGNTVTLIRTGADYTLVTAELTIGDQTQMAVFRPYVTELSIELNAQGSGSDTVSLQNFKACTGGERLSARVSWGSTAAGASALTRLTRLAGKADAVPMLSMTQGGSFQVVGRMGTNQCPLRVDYAPGQYDEAGNLYGKVIDTGKKPEVQVGLYYFPSAMSDQGCFGGDGVGLGHRGVSHAGPDSTFDVDGYIHLDWYSPWIGDQGWSLTRLVGLKGELLAYIAPDWRETEDFGRTGDNYPQFSKVEFTTIEDSGYTPGADKNHSWSYDAHDHEKVQGKFDRNTDTSVDTLVNGLPAKGWCGVNVLGGDNDSGRTAHTHTDVGGILAMYRTFRMEVSQPQAMDFIDGTTKTKKVPCNVSLGTGHETRYPGQNMQVQAAPTSTDSLVCGEMVGYRVDTNCYATDSGKRRTFYYLLPGVNPSDLEGIAQDPVVETIPSSQAANPDSVAVDEEFIQTVDRHLAAVNGSGESWTTDLKFQPIYQYKDVKLRVIPHDHGSFVSQGDVHLEANQTYTYHVGDRLTIAGAPDDTYEFKGYRVRAYATENLNEAPLVNYTEHISEGNTGLFTVGLNIGDATYIELEPVFEKQIPNVIRLVPENGDVTSHLSVANVLTPGEIALVSAAYPEFGWQESDLIVAAHPDLGDDDTADGVLEKCRVHGGDVVQIQAVGQENSDGTYYVPRFSNTYAYAKPFTTNSLDYAALDEREMNVIALSCVTRNHSDDVVYQISGKVELPNYSIRSGDNADIHLAADGYSVFVGAVPTQLWLRPTGSAEVQKLTTIWNPYATTDANGNFQVKGLVAQPDDVFTIRLLNGNTVGVQVVDLSTYTQTDAEFSYYRTTPDDATRTNVETMYTAQGKSVQLTEALKTPVFNGGAPIPISLEYRYDTDSYNGINGTTRNTVSIEDSCFYAILTVNPNGHTLSQAVFTLDKRLSADATYTVKPDPDNPNRFTCFFDGKNMKDIMEAGDMLYVTLYDTEMNRIGYTTYDEYGRATTDWQESPIAYSKLFTGLTFYVPTRDVVPQYLDVPNDLSMELPLLGSAIGTSSTGVLSFTKEKWTADAGVDGFSLLFDLCLSAANKGQKSNMELMDQLRDIPNQTKECADDEFKKIMDDPSYENLSPDQRIDKFDVTYKEAYRNSLNNSFGQAKLNAQALVALRFDFAYLDNEAKYILISGQVVVGGSLSLSKAFYTSIYGVPLFLKIDIAPGIQIQTNFVVYDEEDDDGAQELIDQDLFNAQTNLFEIVPKDNDVGLLIYGSLKLQAGVGVCGVVAARGVVAGDVDIFLAFDELEEFKEDSGIVASIDGGFGLDLVLFSMEYVWDIGTVGCGRYKDATGWLTGTNLSDGLREDSVRAYRMGGGGKVGVAAGGPGEAGMQGRLKAYEPLLTDAPERTRPQLLALPDGRMLLLYLGADKEQNGEINQSALFYSIRDAQGNWSEAVQLEKDGTPDGAPAMALFGDEVLIAWSDASRAITEGESALDVLSCLDISACTFDLETNEMSEVRKISDDGENGTFLDYAPVLCADPDGEKGAAIWFIRKNLSEGSDPGSILTPEAFSESICVGYLDMEDKTGHQRIQVAGDPVISNFDAAFMKLPMGGEEHIFSVCAYVDTHGNLGGTTGWDVCLLLHDMTDDVTYEPMNLCADVKADLNPQLTELGEDLWLTFVTQDTDAGGEDTTFRMMSVNGLMNELQQPGGENGEYTFDLADVLAPSGGGRPWYQKTAAELNMDQEYYKGSIYDMLWRNDFPIRTSQITLGFQRNTLSSRYQILKGQDNRLYLLWTDSASTDGKDYGVELYGVVSTLPTDGDAREWSEPVKLTRFSEVKKNCVVDEFSAAVDDKGDFFLVSSLYTQDIPEEGGVAYSKNNLVSFCLDNSGVLTAEDLSVSGFPKAGEQTAVDVTLKNDSLLPLTVTGYTASSGGTELASGDDVDMQILGGQTGTLSIPVTVPQNLGENTPITVTVTAGTAEQTVSGAFPYHPDLTVTDGILEQAEDGAFRYRFAVANNGNAPAQDCTASVQRTANGLVGTPTTTDLPEIRPGETRTVSVVLDDQTLSKKNFERVGIACLSTTLKQGEEKLTIDHRYVGSADLASVLLINGNYRYLEVMNGSQIKLELSGGLAGPVEDFTFTTGDEKIAYVRDGWLYGARDGTTTLTAVNPDGVKSAFTVTVLHNDALDHPGGSSGGGGRVNTVDIPSAVTNGSISTSATSAKAGQKVTITVTPDEGYEVSAVTVTDANGNAVPVTKNADGTYSFIMPDSAVSVDATFIREGEHPDSANCPKDASCPISRFSDAKPAAWYHDGVHWALDEEIMQGTGETTFEPSGRATRAMVVTMLWRLEGQPAGSPAAPFTDVQQESWYSDAVNWAAENGVTSGTSETTFSPNAPVTREQLVTILYRYADSKGAAESPDANILDYTDAAQISPWAVLPFRWAVQEGIIRGVGGSRLAPKADATRAQIATMFMRFCGGLEA